jgi:hypothetical protein
MDRGRVAEAIACYNSLLETGHMQSTRDHLLSAVNNYGIADEGRSLCTAMRPYFVTQSTYQKAMRTTQLVYAGIRRVAECLAQDKMLRRSIGIPEHIDGIIEIDREKGAFSVTSRLDSFLGPDGAPRFIESNSDPLLPVVAEVDLAFASLPIAQDFAKRFPFRSLRLYDLALDALHINHREQGKAGLPTIAMIRSQTAAISQGGFYRWLAYAAARGCTVLLAKPEEFEYKDHRLSVDGIVVDSLALSTVWDYILNPPDSMKPVLQAIRDGAVRVLNGLSRALLSSYKNTFEMLSDYRYHALFDREVSMALLEHIPWTRVVRDRTTQYRGKNIDLLPFIADHQEEFVLKPGGGRGGVGVVLGWNCTPEVWKATLRRAQAQSYVVQERVMSLDIVPFHFLDGDTVCIRELSVDFNPFVWNGSRAEGCFVRLSNTRLQNLAAGGSIAAVWILEDDTH